MMQYIIISLIFSLFPYGVGAVVVPRNSALQIYDSVSPSEVSVVQYNETDLDFTNRNTSAGTQVTGENDQQRSTTTGEVSTETGIEHDDIGIIAMPPTEDPSVFSGFLKIGDIKGESNDTATDADLGITLIEAGLLPEADDEVLVIFEHTEHGPGGQRMNKADLIESIRSKTDSEGKKKGNIEYEWKIEEGKKTKKPKEIVVVGSKVKEVIRNVGTVEVRGWNPSKKEEVLTEENVLNDDDLTLYIASVLSAQRDIKAISVSDEDVKVAYTVPVKLFGFIPVSMYGEIQADFTKANRDGRVKVKFPWWRVLASGDRHDNSIKADLEEKIAIHRILWSDVTLKRGMVDGTEGGELVGLNPQPDPPSEESSDRGAEGMSPNFSKIKAVVISDLVGSL